MKKDPGKIVGVVTKGTIHEPSSDLDYWRSRSYEERLMALEEIRREYNQWKYSDAEQRFQRICRVTELKGS